MENNLKKLKMTQIFQMPSKIRLYYFLIGMIVFSGSYSIMDGKLVALISLFHCSSLTSKR